MPKLLSESVERFLNPGWIKDLCEILELISINEIDGKCKYQCTIQKMSSVVDLEQVVPGQKVSSHHVLLGLLA